MSISWTCSKSRAKNVTCVFLTLFKDGSTVTHDKPTKEWTWLVPSMPTHLNQKHKHDPQSNLSLLISMKVKQQKSYPYHTKMQYWNILLSMFQMCSYAIYWISLFLFLPGYSTPLTARMSISCTYSKVAPKIPHVLNPV